MRLLIIEVHNSFLSLYAVPSQSPANLKVTDQNSTSISLSWDPIDPSFYHGVFLGYNLTLINEKTGEKRTFIYNKDKLSSVLNGLNEFTKYRIKVCGMTRKGSGADSEILVTTNEDSRFCNTTIILKIN